MEKRGSTILIVAIIILAVILLGLILYLVLRPSPKAECGDGICNGDETPETCLKDCPLGAPQLTQIISETAVTPGDARYRRPEALVIGNSLFMAYEKAGEDAFELVELNEDLSYKTSVKTLYSGPDALSPHDIRLAKAGDKLWYAFETVTIKRDRDTCEGHFLNIAKYDALASQPSYSLNVNEMSGCGTDPDDYRDPSGDFPENPEAVDDPAPIYYNNEYIVMTRAWNGIKQHVRKFNENLDLINYFTLDLGNLPEMQDRILSQFSLVNINGEVYIIAGLIDFDTPNSESGIYAIHLSNDLKSASEAIPLVNYPGRIFRKVNRAIYDNGKLYITYTETTTPGNAYHNLGVYDVNNDFKMMQEIQFQSESFQHNHVGMGIYDNKIYVFYNEGESTENHDVLGAVYGWE